MEPVSADSPLSIIESKTDSYACIVRGWYQDPDTLLAELKHLPFERHQLTLAGRPVREARLSLACSDGAVQCYSGSTRKMHDWNNDPLLSKVRDIGKKISTESGIQLNSCLINYYSDGSQNIGYHADKELKGPNFCVISLSLGGSRDFYMKRVTSGRVVRTTLCSGDIFLMCGRFNSRYQHSVPKRAHANERISLTYRVV